jgi:hypothetical protein
VATGRARLLREIFREEKIEEDDIIDVFVVVCVRMCVFCFHFKEYGLINQPAPSSSSSSGAKQ